jgi:hypothetical protein
LSFVSQTPEMQTRVPTAVVQVETVAGVFGSGVPLESLGTQLPVPPAGLLHHWFVWHCESMSQPMTQVPVVLSQRGAPGWPTQSASVEHSPHWPMFEPLMKQVGLLASEHGSELEAPLSPLQGTHVEDVASHTGVPPEHCIESTQATQLPVVVLQCGVGAEHCESVVQPTQVPFVPQVLERQTVSPFDEVQGPSPLA